MELALVSFIILSSVLLVTGQIYNVPKDAVRWCAVGDYEFKKCQDFALAVKSSGRFTMKLECVKVWSKDECLYKLDSFEADLTILDPGEMFIGGRYHSLIPIMIEKYGQGAENFYYAVAIVNRTSPIRSAMDFQGKRACFSGVGQIAGWVLPIAYLLDNHIMEISDCNNHLRSVAKFFGSSCAPNALLDKNNPTGDNPLQLCERCGTDHQTKCLDSDTFAGFGGAFLCMRGNRGDIAFVKHSTPFLMEAYQGLGVNRNDYELVCPAGSSRAPLGAYQNCNWGKVPSHALVTSSETSPEKIVAYQNFVKLAVYLFGATQGGFRLFESGGTRYGNNYNLLFSDDTTQIESLPEEQQTFKSHLEMLDGQSSSSPQSREMGVLENKILRLRQCPVELVRFCVASDIEMRKCVRMRTAMRAQLLKPEVLCFRGRSQRDCMLAIATSSADLAMLDAGDVFTAGKDFGLIPILAEQYNLDGPYFYAVAVSKIEDPDSDLLFVRGKFTCHTAIGSGAGWIMPVSFLLKNDRLRNWGCDGTRAASEFFQKSCVPGALSGEYNHGWKQNNLCDLCHGTSAKVCQRDHTEDFFGYTGAYRCLVEGGGHIAFIKHTTVQEIADGNNKMTWARNLLSEDYELLCRDGSRKPITEYETCNLGIVPGNAMVTRPGNETTINYYISLFLYAQQFYGSKDNEELYKFQMFRSEFPYNDVIFQDAAQQLVPIPPEQQNYYEYLGYDFVHAKKAVDCSVGSVNKSSFSILVFLVFYYALQELRRTLVPW